MAFVCGNRAIYIIYKIISTIFAYNSQITVGVYVAGFQMLLKFERVH